MECIYFNNAATGWPKADGIVQAIEQFWNHPAMESGRTAGEVRDVLKECRERLARMIACPDPRQIVLTSNATQSINLVAWGLESRLSHVITTVVEHNSILRPLQHIQSRHPALRLTLIECDAQGRLDHEGYERALEDSPSLVAINHASNVTGRACDAAYLLKKAKEAGALTLLDASQSLGLFPVDVQCLDVDFLAFTGHKALHGPEGTGGLFIRPGMELEQFLVGGTGVRSDLLYHPEEMPMRLEAGTPNHPGFAGLNAAMQWSEEKGSEYASRAFNLAERLRIGLQEIDEVNVFDPFPISQRAPIVSFAIAGWDIEDIGVILSESFGIICRTGLHCAPLIHARIGSAPHGTVRFSLSGFNTEEEVEYALHAIQKIAEKK